MPTYLLEIGTEELPADQVSEAQNRLKALMSESLQGSSLKFEEIGTMGTPRRLACIVKGLSAVQDTIHKRIKGPKVQSAFDADGKPLPAASGFAAKHGLTVDQLQREEAGGAQHLVAEVTIEGQPAAAVLKAVVPEVINRLSGERLMRWGACDLKFSRPIRWLVSLLDSEELHISLEGIRCGRTSFGNRVLAPGPITIESPAHYVDKLREARVLVDPEERQAAVKQQVLVAAGKLAGKPRQLNGPLLSEVLNILEWPHAVVGEFETEYLDLPDKLIETIMVHHQRYFPVEKENTIGNHAGKLLPYFITVANNDRNEAQRFIKQGNERVIRARLADGRFFYFDDQKVKLADRKQALAQLTFHEGLGSYLKKTERLLVAGRALSDALQLDAKHSVCLDRTLELCKLDLVTNLVRELPELQGHVGSWYAQREGEPPDVVTALASHYSPRFSDDAIPPDTIGRLAGMLDKLDNLVGLFALGRRPSGSSDPYGLRRNAQGVVDIVMDGLPDFKIDLRALISLLTEEIKPLLAGKRGFDAEKASSDLCEFLLQRVRAELLDKGVRREVVDAVAPRTGVLENLPGAELRARCLESIIESDPTMSLLRAGVRLGNIIDASVDEPIRPELFAAKEEEALFRKFTDEVKETWKKLYPGSANGVRPPANQKEYLTLVNLLVAIAPSIDSFFDAVLVNDPDTGIRANRHALLKEIYGYFNWLAEFPKLQPLLP